MKIRYYNDYVSENLKAYLKKHSKPVAGIKGLTEVGESGGLENPESLRFLCDLYTAVAPELNEVLEQRILDREFIDQRTKACYELNKKLKIDFLDPDYQTLIDQEDGKGRKVVGPLSPHYCTAGGGQSIAPIPDFLKGNHVTLFGPPDDPKLSINAMNAFHRKLKDEPSIVSEILKKSSSVPKWGADDEDSKTPLRQDLISAGENLTGCFDGNIKFTDPKNNKTYELENDHLSMPIKRFPGLALPSPFLFLDDQPIPLHLYDFALHLFKNWHNPKALAFYVPKLETSDEARYIKNMIEKAEAMIHQLHPEYKPGSIRLFIVLENPRAIFRVNEIMDELYPYFAGASLGWHDYLASTARLFKNDANYRIPVKADPNIVIKYIKASHDLLSEVVGSRGGIKIGGMYGVLPIDNELTGASFQITIKGFIKDVVTQMKRNLSGFWVAHPDFIRIGIAITEAWKTYQAGNFSDLENLVKGLLLPKYHKEILDFIKGPDLVGLDPKDILYPRSLLVADIKESTFIANNHPDEVRYNVFQALQYLTDWLKGNGCVALPAQIEGEPVRVMDDLATAERSRWEVWHEIHHGRFSLDEFLKIAHEEMLFIRKDLSNDKKIVQVKWTEETSKWYPLAMKLMIKLMTDEKPVEFATELLLPFTLDSIRNAIDPWLEVSKIDSQKYAMNSYVERFNFYFSICGSFEFAQKMAKNISLDLTAAEKLIRSFSLDEVLEAASFHGDIGESKKTLDEIASKEQSLVLNEDQKVKLELQSLGKEYLQKFGFKFLISAKGKSGTEILTLLKQRLQNSTDTELQNARDALWEISRKRFEDQAQESLYTKISGLIKKHQIKGAQVALCDNLNSHQALSFGEGITNSTYFELASLSKTLASAFAIEYFKSKKISLSTSVNLLLEKTKSPFRIKGEFANDVQITHLMNHTALNLHYVNGVPLDKKMPAINEFLEGNKEYGYEPVKVVNKPGTVFQYSGGGYLVLEHLIETLENKSIQDLTRGFFGDISFEQGNLNNQTYADGFLKDGSPVEGSRKKFPAFAAGAMGNAKAFLKFLKNLTDSFHSLQPTGPISHDTAIRMLFGEDKGSIQFMNAKMGLGVFTLEAGNNRFMLHQGANDGFRCLYLFCYQGPDTGKGFVILCNGDSNGVFFVAEAAQKILKELHFSGIDYTAMKENFDSSQIPSEQIVNMGYKELVLNAFQKDLPEKIIVTGPRDPLAAYNLATRGKVVAASNQGFARAENLISTFLPIFDPELYGAQGKIMDSWETVRHNQAESDWVILDFEKPISFKYISLSTQYHLGNQAPAVQIEGRVNSDSAWEVVLKKIPLEGHSFINLKLDTETSKFKQVRVLMYPDGGLSRLGLFDQSLPDTEKIKFAASSAAKCTPFQESIPQSKKPLAPQYTVSAAVIKKNWLRIPAGSEADVASLALGAKIISATNEHYSPASQVISPYPPLNMFDGSESSRSRDRNHFEQVVIGLARKSLVHRLEIDFSYFRNNNPYQMRLEAKTGDTWTEVLEKTFVKAYAGNTYVLNLPAHLEMSEIKVTVFPDGGINRLRALSFVK